MRGGDVAVVIPAYEEEASVGLVARRARRFAGRVIVADDGSSDGTAAAAEAAGAEVLRLHHGGKGSAVRAALARLREEGFPGTTVLMDADGEHDPSDIPALVRSVEGGADLAVGRRRSHRSTARRALNAASCLLTGLVAPVDAQCGFRALSPRALALRLQADGYEVDMELVLSAAAASLRLASVDLSPRPSRRSRLALADMVRINAFFDRWVLAHLGELRLGPARRLALAVGAWAGLAFHATVGRLAR